MQRPRFSEPSQAFSGTYGSSKEKLLLEAKGIAIMFNEDGSVVIEAFDRQRRIGIRVLPEDAKSHALGLQALERTQMRTQMDTTTCLNRYRWLLSELHAGNSFSKDQLWQWLREAEMAHDLTKETYHEVK